MYIFLCKTILTSNGVVYFFYIQNGGVWYGVTLILYIVPSGTASFLLLMECHCYSKNRRHPLWGAFWYNKEPSDFSEGHPRTLLFIGPGIV